MLILYVLLVASGGVSVVIILRLAVMIRRFSRYDIAPLPPSHEQLPTVSVCVPARDETHAMTQCLERVVASTYPKLEIIVLDDGSTDNTSVLIKSFAHSGVRFVEGAPLPEAWLGKNHAEQELLRESSGELVLYLDVDTHIRPYTIDRLVSVMMAERAAMVSVLPTREDIWRGSILFATLRYFWTIVMHRKTLPAVASSAWLVRRDFLQQKFDGLRALRHVVEPERLVAAEAMKTSAYRFLISTGEIGVSYEKKWQSQIETSKRLLYPVLGGRVIQVLAAYSIVALMLLPFVWVVTAVAIGWQPSHLLACGTAILMIAGYTLYTARVWRKGWLIGGLIIPFVLIQELYLLTASVHAYATRTVTWKGRPITASAQSVMRPVFDLDKDR